MVFICGENNIKTLCMILMRGSLMVLGFPMCFHSSVGRAFGCYVIQGYSCVYMEIPKGQRFEPV